MGTEDTHARARGHATERAQRATVVDFFFFFFFAPTSRMRSSMLRESVWERPRTERRSATEADWHATVLWMASQISEHCGPRVSKQKRAKEESSRPFPAGHGRRVATGVGRWAWGLVGAGSSSHTSLCTFGQPLKGPMDRPPPASCERERTCVCVCCLRGATLVRACVLPRGNACRCRASACGAWRCK